MYVCMYVCIYMYMYMYTYIYIYIYVYIYKIVMENEDGQLRAKENIYSKNSKNDKKFNKKRFGL